MEEESKLNLNAETEAGLEGLGAVSFEPPIAREGRSEKYDLRKIVFGSEDVLPMWVADMDLATPSFVREAIAERLSHPILGYESMPKALYSAIVDWQAFHHYVVESKHILFTHNVANGFFLAVQAFSQPNQAVMVMPPIYPPFFTACTLNHRQVVEAPLKWVDGCYQMDFALMAQRMQTQQVKLLLLSNPQNPSGRVWSRAELMQLAALCLQYGVVIVSDEIHSDLTLPPAKHIPVASLSSDIANITVTLNSPGKSFNLAALHIGYAIIANATLRAAYKATASAVKVDSLNTFAAVATQAAYSAQGRDYLAALLTHISANIDLVEVFFETHCPNIKVMRPQASYLIWLDFSAYFNNQSALKHWLVYQAKLGLNDGESFGTGGKGFMRMNVAVPRSVLQQALTQLKVALVSLPELLSAKH